MDEFEARLTDSLQRAASSAQGSPTGLLAGAQQQAHRRRGRRLTGLALVTLAVGITAGLPLVLGRTADGPVEAPSGLGSGRVLEARSMDWVPEGWRVESWRDVTWAVPAGWGYGDLSQWCVQEHQRRPLLQRPLGASTQVGCGPTLGYGMVVSPEPLGITDPENHQPGAAVEQRVVRGTHVLVSTTSAALTARILDTAHAYREHDANGCPGRLTVPGRGRDERNGVPLRDLLGSDRLSVCRYSTRLSGPNLDQSELLTPHQSRDAYRALHAAPAGSGPDAPFAQCVDWPEQQAVAVLHGTDLIAWVHYDGCRGHGLDLQGRSRELTSNVTYWALSPGFSGGVDGSVPLPSRFRQLSD